MEELRIYRISTVPFPAGTVTETTTNAYDNGKLLSATLSRKINDGDPVNLRRVSYVYDGNLLKQVDLEEADDNSGSWQSTGSRHYRYYAADDGQGQRLKLALGTQAYERAANANTIGNVADATDEALAPFADFYYEYDAKGRVIVEKTEGGAKVYTFDYETSSAAQGFNLWSTKTTETLPDQSQNVVYTNFAGRTILKEHKVGAQRWIEYHVFNQDGRIAEEWTPAAVSGYLAGDGTTEGPATGVSDEGSSSEGVTEDISGPVGGAIMVTGKPSGLIHITEYASETTASGTTAATAGDVKGYPCAFKIRDGQSGTEITQRTVKYYQHINKDGRKTYPQAESTVYSTDDGTKSNTTRYEYTWHPDPSDATKQSSQICQKKTILPAVSFEEHGENVAHEAIALFDPHGNEIWQRGSRGFIRHREFDVSRGVLLRQTEDFDTSSIPASQLPETDNQAWSTPSGAGLHVTTEYQYDAMGRRVQTLGPVHQALDENGTEILLRRANWTVYKSSHETWSASGYQRAADDGFVLVNPVSIHKRSPDGSVVDQIVAVRTAANGDPLTDGKLSANDLFDNQSTWVRWSHQKFDNQGRMIASRVYHEIPVSGEGLKSQSNAPNHYDETVFGYDLLGNPARTVSPGGTITRTLFDARKRPVAQWVGTDDTPTNGEEWSPTNNTAGTNLVLTSETEYDHGDVGNGLATRQTLKVDDDPSNDRVTELTYDWRDRVVRTTSPPDENGNRTYRLQEHDNADRTTRVQNWLEDATDGDTLLEQNESLYDSRGRVYQRIQGDRRCHPPTY